MRASSDQGTRGLAAGLIGLGILARLLPHPWNATPTMAIALFGGAHLSRRWSLIVPLVIVGVSDVFLGWHATIPFTWSAFALTGMLGWWLRQRPSVARVAGGSLTGSVFFFLITNFGVWVTGELYPMTMAGLWQCYAMAIPFFRNTLLGDLVWTTALFGTYALVGASRLVRQPIRSG